MARYSLLAHQHADGQLVRKLESTPAKLEVPERLDGVLEEIGLKIEDFETQLDRRS